jgi:hypothetical protein
MKNVYEYMNVSSEHLGPDYRDLTFRGCTPMFSTEPKYQSRFLLLDSICDMKLVYRLSRDEPCIILSGAHDLNVGDAREVLALLPTIRQTKLYFTDPDVQELPSGLPLPQKLEVFNLPIDPRVSAVDLANLLQNIKPQRLCYSAIPEEYQWTLSDVVSEMKPIKVSFNRVNVEICNLFSHVQITPKVRCFVFMFHWTTS